jgi:hypothetical protein
MNGSRPRVGGVVAIATAKAGWYSTLLARAEHVGHP